MEELSGKFAQANVEYEQRRERAEQATRQQLEVGFTEVQRNIEKGVKQMVDERLNEFGKSINRIWSPWPCYVASCR